MLQFGSTCRKEIMKMELLESHRFEDDQEDICC
jgi:hypothetical protein